MLPALTGPVRLGVLLLRRLSFAAQTACEYDSTVGHREQQRSSPVEIRAQAQATQA